MANSTLDAIRIKVRRLTRTPSATQITDAQIDEYINTFIQYDFPEHLRLFSLRTTHSFTTQPYQDTYPTDILSFAGAISNPLYNFKNRFITVHPPFYIAGYESFFTQSQTNFFRIYPKLQSLIDTQLRGNGILTTFAGIIRPPGGLTPSGKTSLLQYEVLLSSVDNNNNGLALVDRPLVGIYGNNLSQGNLYVSGTVPSVPPVAIDPINSIDYVTGAFTVTFPTAPAPQQPIMAQVVPVQVSRPLGVLYYDNTFIVRPVPDQPYTINFEAYIRATELLANNQSPDLEQWWQYIAYGAAKKIFEDKMDLESVQQIMPEYKQQERLVLRRTLVQQSNERVATIYTNNTSSMYGPGWFAGGGLF